VYACVHARCGARKGKTHLGTEETSKNQSIQKKAIAKNENY